MERDQDERVTQAADDASDISVGSCAPRARIVGTCWICRAAVRAREATIAPTVCARCYDSLHSHWR
jgi:hypothetical protein